MMKKLIIIILSKFGYELIKKDKVVINNSFEHNKLENVNTVNKDMKHFRINLKNDKKTIDGLYPILKENIVGENLSILDVGCGSGVLVDKLIKDYERFDVYGCDFSEVKIAQCNKYYNSNKYFTSDIYNLDKNDRKYDIITCTEVLEHLKFPDIALKSLFNSLSSNGKLFITVPDGRKDFFAGHIHFWSQESFKLFLNKVFDNMECSFVHEYYFNKNIAIITKLN